jgi:hypothetical protein
MNAYKPLLRLLILTQVFTLFLLLLMPVLVRFLGEVWGKVTYSIVALLCVGLALGLRYANSALDQQ